MHSFFLFYIVRSLFTTNEIFIVNQFYNNFDFLKGRSKFRISTLYDYSDQNFTLGVIDSKTNYSQFFSSLSHKYRFNANGTIQYGIDFSNSLSQLSDERKSFYRI